MPKKRRTRRFRTSFDQQLSSLKGFCGQCVLHGQCLEVRAAELCCAEVQHHRGCCTMSGLKHRSRSYNSYRGPPVHAPPNKVVCSAFAAPAFGELDPPGNGGRVGLPVQHLCACLRQQGSWRSLACCEQGGRGLRAEVSRQQGFQLHVAHWGAARATGSFGLLLCRLPSAAKEWL